MRQRCILGAGYNMMATVLNHVTIDNPADLEAEVTGGHWESYQDEDTGAIRNRWVEDVATPTMPGQSYIVNANRFEIECVARGFTEVGFRSTANTESFLDGRFTPMEVIRINYPAKYQLNRRMLVTNIRNRDKQIVWVEEETGNPTVFEVQGATPNFDPFGRHIDNMAVLRRSEVQ